MRLFAYLHFGAALGRLFGILPDTAEEASTVPGGEIAEKVYSHYNLVPGKDSCKACKGALRLLQQSVKEGKLDHIAQFLKKSCKLKHGSFCDHLRYYSGKDDNILSILSEKADELFSFLPDLMNALKHMDIDGFDGSYFCHYLMHGACERPHTPRIDFSTFLPPYPAKLEPLPKSKGETFNVLHVSDIHLSSTYLVGSEANCLGYMCCTKESMKDPRKPSQKATPYGGYKCDTPMALLDSTLQNVSHVPYDFALFTGDMVDHDPAFITKSRTITEEKEVLEALKRNLGNVPVYCTLGNHDTYPYAQEARSNSPYCQKFSYNTELMRHMWTRFNWLSVEDAKSVSLHHGAYSVMAHPKLKIIALNSNMYFLWNFYNYVNSTDPTCGGALSFLVDELAQCEKQGLKAWIIAHVPPGGTASETLPVPSNFLSAIFERFDANIAGIFFGHTHRDEFTVQYVGPKVSENALKVAYIAPSVTPHVDRNPAWRYYKVDTETFEIMDVVNYQIHLNDTFCGDPPEWRLSYSTRETYNKWWPETASLNATYWHFVAEDIRHDLDFAQTFLNRAYRDSPNVPICDTKCQLERYCFSTCMTNDEVVECCGAPMPHGAPTFPMPRPQMAS